MAIDWFLVVLAAMFLVREFLEPLAEPLRSRRRRLALVWGGVYAFAVIAGGFALASDAEATSFVKAAVIYAPAVLLGLLLDLIRGSGHAK